MISRLLSPIALPLAGALAVALAAACGALWLLHVWLEDAEADLRAAQAKLQTCVARIENLREDIESDATVTDPGLFDVPDRWVLPE